MYYDHAPHEMPDAYVWCREETITAVGGHLEMADLRYLEAFVRGGLRPAERTTKKILKAGGEVLLALAHEDRGAWSSTKWSDQDKHFWIVQDQERRPYFRCDQDISEALWPEVREGVGLFFSIPTSDYHSGLKTVVEDCRIVVQASRSSERRWDVCIESLSSTSLTVTISSKTKRVDSEVAAKTVAVVMEGEVSHIYPGRDLSAQTIVLQGPHRRPAMKALRLLEAHVTRQLRG